MGTGDGIKSYLKAPIFVEILIHLPIKFGDSRTRLNIDMRAYKSKTCQDPGAIPAPSLVTDFLLFRYLATANRKIIVESLLENIVQSKSTLLFKRRLGYR